MGSMARVENLLSNISHNKSLFPACHLLTARGQMCAHRLGMGGMGSWGSGRDGVMGEWAGWGHGGVSGMGSWRNELDGVGV